MRDATEIIMVLDKSGSMESIKSDTIGGFNHFLKDQQKEPGEANLTLVFFDTTYTIYPAKPIKTIKPLNHKTFVPGGCTALLDAIGRAVIETGKRLADMQEVDRPDKVIMVIMTDGLENASLEHNHQQVKDMIKHQEEKYSWKFIFLGAGPDAFAEGTSLGLDSVFYTASSIGTRSAYQGTTQTVAEFRKTGAIKRDWKKGIK